VSNGFNETVCLFDSLTKDADGKKRGNELRAQRSERDIEREGREEERREEDCEREGER